MYVCRPKHQKLCKILVQFIGIGDCVKFSPMCVLYVHQNFCMQTKIELWWILQCSIRAILLSSFSRSVQWPKSFSSVSNATFQEILTLEGKINDFREKSHFLVQISLGLLKSFSPHFWQFLNALPWYISGPIKVWKGWCIVDRGRLKSCLKDDCLDSTVVSVIFVDFDKYGDKRTCPRRGWTGWRWRRWRPCSPRSGRTGRRSIQNSILICWKSEGRLFKRPSADMQRCQRCYRI